MKIHEHMKQERLRRGLTVKELADKSGVSANSIYGYESGRQTPNLEYLLWICIALGTTVDGYIGVDYDA